MQRAHPFTVIFSLSRCGSTSIHRALNLHRKCRLLYEPDFECDDVDQIVERRREHAASSTGMKHVWDPSGFPFRADHRSELDDIETNIAKWVSYNQAILNAPKQRIVFLTREDEQSRIVSDFLGQATNVWGPKAGDAHSTKTGQQYSKALTGTDAVTLPIDTMRWYVDHIPRINRELRNSISAANPVFDLSYEEIFSPGVSEAQRMNVFGELLAFLDLSTNPLSINLKRAANIMAPSGKLNSEQTYREKIENFEDVRELLGWELG